MAEQRIARIIDGKAIAQAIIREIQQDVEQFKQLYDRVPGLAIVIVGERKDSRVYARMKTRACTGVGIRPFVQALPASTSEETLLRIILELNDNPQVDATMMQV